MTIARLSLGLDNTAARNLSYNPEHHARTKHIARPRHFFFFDFFKFFKKQKPTDGGREQTDKAHTRTQTASDTDRQPEKRVHK